MVKWLSLVAKLSAFLDAFAAFALRLEKEYGADDPDAREASSLLSSVRGPIADARAHVESSSEPQPNPGGVRQDDSVDGVQFGADGESFRF